MSICPALANAGVISISQPAYGATVSGPTTVSLVTGAGVSWSNIYVDGNYYASTPPSSIIFHSRHFSNGNHSITATAYAGSGNIAGSQTIVVSVANFDATPTATPTPAPTSAPTPAIKLTSPASGARVSGTVPVAASKSSAVSWSNFYIDGNWVSSSSPYSYNWNTTAARNGSHTVSVNAYDGSGAKIGSDSLSVTVSNVAQPTPTVSQVSTPVGTSTPTVVPTVNPTITATAAKTPTTTMTPTATPSAGANTYYVSPTGSDGNNGVSPANAWGSVRHGANTMGSGDVLVVTQGTYNERVTIVKDGITIQADPAAASTPVIAQGFDIAAKNVTVNGFEISFQNNNNPDGVGIHVHDASGVVIENNYIHDTCHEGIFLEPTVSNIQVLNNKMVHVQMAGVEIDGTGSLVQGNEVWGTYQHPSALGGIYAGCTNDGGGSADADAFRFFGSNHIIRYNYAHDIEYDFGDTSKPNPSPHTDCFQTWGAAGENTTNILIERNTCRWPSNGAQGPAAEVSSIEALDGPVGNITFQNNIFQDMLRGVNATQDGGLVIGQLNFYNNTFDHLKSEAIIVDGVRNDNIENNIFYDVTGYDGFIAYHGGENFAGNVFYNRSGAPGTGLWWGGSAAPSFLAIDPMFVNYGDSTGLGADYHLCIAGQHGCSASSPIGHNGMTILSVPNDRDGNARTPGYSIGSEQIMN